MGSPPLRLAAFALAAVLAGAAALPARADQAGATATATAFLNALAISDGQATCALFSPEALAKVGGTDKCVKLYGPQPEEADFEAVTLLRQALHAAEKSAVKRRGAFVTRRLGPAALARDMQRMDDELVVKLGQGPSAAAGELSTTVILDRRSNARRVVLYAESDDGSIFRLSSAMLGTPDVDEVAQGVPEQQPRPPEPAFAFELGAVAFDQRGYAYVNATIVFTIFDEELRHGFLLELVPSGSGYLVGNAFASLVDIVGIEG